ncbi:hypothetical protein PVAND_001383 [Polypedilum vanderplanki]|uniref:Nascent polypeptide-associated complex subunit alpha-like UBA domain-containing protein n=1 Tax=Polypedilum vanderplanki TaxID=319348 RepID=A0A9J6BMT3_POLVA|nr:hypothetical protein PVAND_001383 [Polypedilum vanderplanki]
MASVEVEVEELNGDDQQDKKQKKHNSGAADLERVTDFQEEAELSNAIANAAQLFVEKGNREAEAKLAKEVELQKIHIKKADIDRIVLELEVTTSIAEKALRENKGDIVEALKFLLRD